MRKRQGWLLLCWISSVFIGCTQPISSALTEELAEPLQPLVFANAPAFEAIPHLIAAERQGAAARDLAWLAQLWAPDSRIVDGRGTTDPSDDYIWDGNTAILDRYVMSVFPNAPPPLAPEVLSSLQIMVEDNYATTQNGVDHWIFVHRDERWWLLELKYN